MTMPIKRISTCLPALAVLLCTVLAACTGPTTVPKPRGFARIQPYADSMASVSLPDVMFVVNAEADIDRPQTHWLNVRYVRYGATMHITSYRYEDEDSLFVAIANRRERVLLNAAGRHIEETSFTSVGDCRVYLFTTVEPTPIPFQFIAIGDDGTFVSGAVALTGNVEPADSVAPVLRDLSLQVDTLLHSLSPR